MIYDTIIIGAGIAGMLAAIGRAEAGERVLVLAKGHAATHWATGCVDLLDVGAADPLAGIEALITTKPDHPYTLAGLDALQNGLARLQAICAAGGYPLVGSLHQNLMLPTAVGALRPTCLVPVTMVAGDARQLPRQGDGTPPVLVAGFREIRDFFPSIIAANLQKQGFAAEDIYLPIPATPRSDFTSTTFARLFDQPAFRAEVGQTLRSIVHAGGYRRILLPAVLGLHQATQVLAELQAIAGALIAEIPTLPASVPGMRLYQYLAAALIRAGGRIQLGAFVQRAEADGDRLVAIYTAAAAREECHRAQRYVLATGGILGGGVRAVDAEHLVETALDLPLHTPASRDEWLDPQLLNSNGHPVFCSGIAVDSLLRPYNGQGQIVYTNVAVVGSALAGYDPIRTGAREGIAIATGWRAGKL